MVFKLISPKMTEKNGEGSYSVRNFKRVSVAAGALFAALTMMFTLSPTASAVDNMLMNQSGWCLGVDGGYDGNGGSPMLWTCNNNPDQHWVYSRVGSDSSGTYYNMTNDSGRCLGILNGSRSAGTGAILWDCNGNDDQHWYIDRNYRDSSGNLMDHLRNRGSGMCLGSLNGGGRGAYMIQWPCNNNPDQIWYRQN
ncbi:RICIN domain-containing protein [Streptomyces sp. NPDC023838]|uniref:RICIN domain-containing protein n=1 Tax=Streptomyces sp. NPDC023838 TaxID=3154325 RepID=UPI0033D9FB5E